jgi:hypothetical protein
MGPLFYSATSSLVLAEQRCSLRYDLLVYVETFHLLCLQRLLVITIHISDPNGMAVFYYFLKVKIQPYLMYQFLLTEVSDLMNL